MLSLSKGTIIENTYEILEEIGAGGGGIIYKARHLRLQTDVVVKKIKDEVIDKVKTRQEADILKKLKHPFLPRVYDFVETKDGIYTVMDYIQGQNLEDALKTKGKYSQKIVKKWAEQLSEALDYLHSQKPPIIHSDIKPANIMLTDDGDICLIDFNISLAMGSSMESAVGISAGFSPPEQYRDPVLYAELTHNYTEQKAHKLDRVLDDDKTEFLGEKNGNGTLSSVKDNSTVLLEETEDSRTVLLEEADDVKTLLLVNSDEDNKTVLLNSEDDNKTELLVTPNSDERNNVSIDENVKLNGKSLSYTRFMGNGIDTRSDIYSLGVTLYVLLTGVIPPMDFDKRIPISKMNVPVSEGFAVILEKMMELIPDERYKNGQELHKAIRNCYKLDHRYIQMHWKETGLQLAATAAMSIGILGILGGLFLTKKEKNQLYFGYIQRAEEAMSIGNYEESEALLENAKNISNTKIDAYEEEVYLPYLNGNYEECIKRGEDYLNTMPFLLESKEDREQLSHIYYIVGNAYFELKDYVNARQAFEYAVEKTVNNPLYYRDYAITLAKQGQIEQAEEQLNKAVSLGIAEDSVYMAQGEIAHVKGMYDDADRYLNQTIMLTDDAQMKRRAIMLCVDLYKTMGNGAIDREISLLEQYSGQYSGNGYPIMTEYLADAYTRKAQSDRALENKYYLMALERFQSIMDEGYASYQLQENIAILHENLNEFDEAEAILLQMADNYPKRYEVYKRLAYLEADRQQGLDIAIRDYKKMLEYYEKAMEMYDSQKEDLDMSVLDKIIRDLRDGGWID